MPERVAPRQSRLWYPKPVSVSILEKGFGLPIYLFMGFLTVLWVVASNAALLSCIFSPTPPYPLISLLLFSQLSPLSLP